MSNNNNNNNNNELPPTDDDNGDDLELMEVHMSDSERSLTKKRDKDITTTTGETSRKVFSEWILEKLKPKTNNNSEDADGFQPLKSSDSADSASPDRTMPEYDEEGNSNDREEASSGSDDDDGDNKLQQQHQPPRLHRRRFLHPTTSVAMSDSNSNNNIMMSGIEVEIDSSVSGDDCLYRKRYLNTVWMIYKTQILLGCAFVCVFLFGVLIGACGSGQCGRGGDSDTSFSASSSGVKWSDIPVECNTDHAVGDGSGSGEAGQTTAQSGVHVSDLNSSSSPATTTTTAPPLPPIVNPEPTFLGPNTIIFDPSMTTAEIQSQADAIFRQQQNNEMGTERYALLFEPGTYGSVAEPLMIQIGYYTEVSGLGASPRDVQVIGKIEVYNRCFEPDPYADGKFIPTDNSEEGLCFALNSFWRGLSNLSIQVISRNQDQCRSTAMFWAISQAASMRRVNIEGGDVSLMDYCSNPAYASGGFIADSKAGRIISGSQQQFITRNSNVAQWDGSAWNQVLVGVVGAPDDRAYPNPPITTLEINPMSREKPYLFVNEAGEYHVHAPSFNTATRDVSWGAGYTPGRTIPISEFYVASPSDSVETINEQLAAGKNLLLTPGQYKCSATINLERAETVVLGIGLATLTAVDGAIPLKIASQPGIIVAGVTVDAGLTLSPVLLQVGNLGDSVGDNGDPNNPITLSDVYFRVGGPHIGKSNVCLEINSNHVLVDHTWVWRADHGVENFDKTDGFDGDNERWRTNTGLNGVVVNGNDVTATGLFVEHFQEYNLVWNGERGRVYFFQNELPYEPPSQEEWTADDGTLGWAAYKVNTAVTEHELWCGGVYCYNRNNPDVVTTNAFEAPNREGVTLNRIYTRNLSGPGTILNIVNGVGQTVTDEEKGPFYVVRYPQKR